jgi:two-component system, chemotaxis family, protein-glutamate methylesterase/glutaminase
MKKDIFVIGSSAGGIDALRRLVRNLPADINAALFVVQHVPSWHRSELPEILRANSRLYAVHAESGQRIQRGHIYVAPPDRHLLLEDRQITLWKGPRENRSRPAINPLFRSAATSYGDRVVGVILSGLMDDGSAGLWMVKRAGGTAIVQDPLDTAYPEMPQNAMRYVKVDYIASAPAIAKLLAKISAGDSNASQQDANPSVAGEFGHGTRKDEAY